jgi:hypothetical protein
MYKIISVLLIFLATANANAQSVGDISKHIADKMKDSLNLSQVQRDSILSKNQQLQSMKLAARQNASPETLQVQLQNLEKMRDSLYRPVLTQQQFELYRQKKRALISAN